jgi:FPC/CPF motif-containing protein YcgG
LSTQDPEETENPLFELDPFSPRLAFAEKRGMSLRTAGDREGMRPLKPIDTRADKFLEIDELEKLAAFQGLFRSPVEQSQDAYPEHMKEALRNVEAQFILRNLARAVRMVDPDEHLEFEFVDSGRTNIATALADSRSAKIERVELLEEMTPQLVGNHRSFIKGLYDDTAWERHFSREIKERITGPIWRYDPDAPVEDEAPTDDS